MTERNPMARPVKRGRRSTDGLTPLERAFIGEYLTNGQNATAAYRVVSSGRPSDATAQREGHRLLQHPQVRARLDAVTAKAAEALEITAERILAELARIGFSDIRDAVKFGPDGITLVASTDLSPAVAACIAEVSKAADGSTRVKFHDKLAALDKLGRHMRLFSERVEVTGRLTLEALVAASARPAAANEPSQPLVVPALPAQAPDKKSNEGDS